MRLEAEAGFGRVNRRLTYERRLSTLVLAFITIGKKAEAIELLKSFVTVDGKYKATADSLLQTLK